MDDLNAFADKFKKWRGNKRHYRYPKHFWDGVRQLTEIYPLQVISKTLSISLPYLKQKFLKDSQPITFASVKVSSLQAPVSIEFLDRKARKVLVHFQADPMQIAQLILRLLKEGNLVRGFPLRFSFLRFARI